MDTRKVVDGERALQSMVTPQKGFLASERARAFNSGEIKQLTGIGVELIKYVSIIQKLIFVECKVIWKLFKL